MKLAAAKNPDLGKPINVANSFTCKYAAELAFSKFFSKLF